MTPLRWKVIFPIFARVLLDILLSCGHIFSSNVFFYSLNIRLRCTHPWFNFHKKWYITFLKKKNKFPTVLLRPKKIIFLEIYSKENLLCMRVKRHWFTVRRGMSQPPANLKGNMLGHSCNLSVKSFFYVVPIAVWNPTK